MGVLVLAAVRTHERARPLFRPLTAALRGSRIPVEAANTLIGARGPELTRRPARQLGGQDATAATDRTGLIEAAENDITNEGGLVGDLAEDPGKMAIHAKRNDDAFIGGHFRSLTDQAGNP